MLSEHDNNVCVIDRDPSAFAALGRDFNGSTFVGVGYDEEILVTPASRNATLWLQ